MDEPGSRPDASPGDRLDEFGEIERLFRPLTHGAPEARGLLDDVAVLAPRPGFDLVITQDAMVEGVHFLADDPFDLVGRKLLRVNLSDLAAKGAEPFGWFLTVAWPPRAGRAQREAFAAGLAQDQARYGLSLLGGDTVSTPGPWTLSATLLGHAPSDATPSRGGAQPGDVLLVSGEIGDAGLGLMAAQGRGDFGEDAAVLIDRYHLPQPRLELAGVVRAFAQASCDVSDGLLADAGRLAAASGCAVEVDLDAIPLSAAARRWAARGSDPVQALAELATLGDDYEILIAASPDAVDAARAAAQARGRALAAVGRFAVGEGVRASHGGRPVALTRLGWTHGRP